ncbi:metal-dependent protein hydrolase [Blastocladiella britannica]|nr:metal-dependent protein hydrolase [Blastocladiella britannica]
MSASPSSPAAKRARIQKTIVTHSGSFHADEALAVHMLRLLPEYRDANVVRSRDPAVWAEASILVDVGAKYDPSVHQYDHHQREFTDTFDAAHTVTRLSSAGLVYKHFGLRALSSLLLGDGGDQDETKAAKVGAVYARLYDDLIEAFDAIDNGVSRYPRTATAAYKDATSLSSVVAKLNPYDGEPNATADGQFARAVAVVGSHFDRSALHLYHAWLPARAIVRDALAARVTRGHLIVMESFAPWKDHLVDLEVEAGLGALAATVTAPLAEKQELPSELPLYVVFPDPSGSWRIQAVPVHPDSFECRKPLPAAWRGVRDTALDALTGAPGGVFIHAAGFIGGHQTREGAIKLAEMAVDM